jgi:ribose 5-phosphate isomerase B
MWYPHGSPAAIHTFIVTRTMPDNVLAQKGDTVAIASDHAGVGLKDTVAKDLTAMGFKVMDLGTTGTDSVDYPDYGHALAQAIQDRKAKAGVAICGTGIGISIAANRHPGVRAALVYDDNTARMAREHNDANIVAMGARTTPPEKARELIKTFFATAFGGGRHSQRVAKLG